MKDKKLHAFMLNDVIDFNIDELVTYIEDNCPSIDIFNIKKNYVHIQQNGQDLNKVLTEFICEKVTDAGEEVDDLEELVSDNLDRFFDITDKSDDIVIVERMQNN